VKFKNILELESYHSRVITKIKIPAFFTPQAFWNFRWYNLRFDNTDFSYNVDASQQIKGSARS